MNHCYETNLPNFSIRPANETDVPHILKFIKELAEYEDMSSQVIATEQSLLASIFEKQQAEVILAEHNQTVIGFALFFQNYSTFIGQSNLYLEDLYVQKPFRGKGYGKALLQCLSKIALEKNCKRLDWACLNWNTPSINFYKSIGAKPLEEWITFRMEEESLKTLASQ